MITFLIFMLITALPTYLILFNRKRIKYCRQPFKMMRCWWILVIIASFIPIVNLLFPFIILIDYDYEIEWSRRITKIIDYLAEEK